MNIYTKSLIDTLYFSGVIIAFGLMLGVLRNATLENFRRSGGRLIVFVTALIGVPIHELGHLMFALIFRHKIGKVRLLQFKKNDNTLGYVEHSSNPLSLYQQLGNFFIGIGPIIGGTLSIIFLMKILLPTLYNQFVELSILNLGVSNISKQVFINTVSSYGNIMFNMVSFDNFKNLNFIVFVILSICISSHISLSSSDIKGAFKGLLLFYVLVLCFNTLAIPSLFKFDFMSYNILITSFLAISLFFSLLTYLISYLFVVIFRNT